MIGLWRAWIGWLLCVCGLGFMGWGVHRVGGNGGLICVYGLILDGQLLRDGMGNGGAGRLVWGVGSWRVAWGWVGKGMVF